MYQNDVEYGNGLNEKSEKWNNFLETADNSVLYQ